VASLAHAKPPGREQQLAVRLQRAHAAGNRDELERAAKALRVKGVRHALRGARALRLAALAAAPLCEKSWLLLPELTELMGEADPKVAAAAGEATLRVAEDLRPLELEVNEDLPVTLRPVSARLVSLARSARPAETRLPAVRALAQLLEVAPVESKHLLPLLDDPSAPIRRAAVELFGRSPDDAARERLGGVVANDRSADVARAAAAVLCAQVPTSRRVASPVIAVLRTAGALARLRELARDADAPVDEVADIARCLARGGRAEQKVHRELLRRPSVRRILRRE
jgi:hypothetical protein